MENVFRRAAETCWWKVFTACNFEVSKLNISLPAFSKQCLVAWSELNEREPSSVHEITNQVIWNNKFLCVDKKPVYRRDIAYQGFCKIWDLFSVDDEQLNPEKSFFIMKVINSMPAAWRFLIRTANIAPVLSSLANTPAILINDILIPILDAFSKFKAHLSVFSGEKNKLQLPLKRSSPACRACEAREKKTHFSRLSPVSLSVFSLVPDLLFDCSRVLVLQSSEIATLSYT